MITLYKIDNTDSVREWSIEVEGNKYRTSYGQKNGKIVQTEWTICTGKNIGRANETSPEQQALLEAKSIIETQREKGYDEKAEKKTGNVMLAKSYDDFKDKIQFPVYSQPKLDGIRSYITSKGMFTRNHKSVVACPHIFNACKTIFEMFPNLRLDGEMYNHDFKQDFNSICSIVKKTKPTKEDIEKSEQLMQYHIYDIGDTTKSFLERSEFLEGIFEQNIKLNNNKYLKLVYTDKADAQPLLDKLYENYLEEGYEGQMVRLGDYKYEEKRSKGLLKRKEFQDAEFKITKVVEGLGNKSGQAGHMEFYNEDGKWFKSNIKGTWEFCTQCLKDKDKLVGKMATIKYFNRTPDNIPRFPYVIAIRDYE